MIHNNKRGFIKTIVLLVVALLLMRHYDVTITGVIDWMKSVTPDRIFKWLEEAYMWLKALVLSVW